MRIVFRGPRFFLMAATFCICPSRGPGKGVITLALARRHAARECMPVRINAVSTSRLASWSTARKASSWRGAFDPADGQVSGEPIALAEGVTQFGATGLTHFSASGPAPWSCTGQEHGPHARLRSAWARRRRDSRRAEPYVGLRLHRAMAASCSSTAPIRRRPAWTSGRSISIAAARAGSPASPPRP